VDAAGSVDEVHQRTLALIGGAFPSLGLK